MNYKKNIYMNTELELCPNPLVQYLNKPASEFTKADLIKYIEDNDVEMVNFRYVAEDGRLKTLNFVISSKDHLDAILSSGERVDGSSLFSHISAGASDLYVIPRYKTAFLNPFSEIPTLDILCSFFDSTGNPYTGAPEYILKKSHEVLKRETGYSFEIMGELEYYVIDTEDKLFEPTDQRNYHESEPFAKNGDFRRECMLAIAQCGGSIKYGHSEVGNFVQDGLSYEQNEIEFLPTNLEDAADQLIIAKWIIRTLAYQYGYDITFSPKITIGKAGSGMHIHTRLMKDGKNAFVDNGVLNDIAKRVIAGYLDLAPSLTAFGNTNPTSYFRLVPHQEAPTNVCWGDRNRSVLVRVPLGWRESVNMAAIANPLEDNTPADYSVKQTVEFRCPDGSADIYLLAAGLTVAARHGLQMENALEYAKKTYVDVNIFNDENKSTVDSLEQLPTCCVDSADKLKDKMDVYKKYDVFPEDLLVNIEEKLRAYNDADIREEISDDPVKVMELVKKYFHV